MTPSMLLPKFLFDGLFVGSYYGLIALGIAIIFGVLKVGDVAQGGLFVLGGYLTYTLVETLGLGYFLSPVIIVPVTAVISLMYGTLVYRKIREHGIAPTFLAAVSLLLIIQSLLAIGYGERVKTVRSPIHPVSVNVGGTAIYSHKLFVVLVTAATACLVWYAVKKTKWGRSLRALSGNYEIAVLSGINPTITTGIAFAISGALAGFSGFLTAPVYSMTPFSGRLTVLKAFVISRIGGGSVPTVIGLAVMLGLSESLTSAYFLGEFSNLVPFVLLIGITLLNPDVLGPEERRRITGRSLREKRSKKPAYTGYFSLILPVMFLLPAIVDLPRYFTHLGVTVGTLSIAVMSVDLLYGYVGLPSLVQGGFFGVGAYAAGVITLELEGAMLYSLVGAVVSAGVVGFVVGVMGVRAGRHWTSFTFIVTIIFTVIATNLVSLTGGPGGLPGITGLTVRLPLLGRLNFNPFANPWNFYLLVFAIFALTYVGKNLIIRSRFGRSIEAIREDEVLAESIGIPVGRYKVLAFVLSAGMAGLGGALYAHYMTYINPEMFNFVTSFKFLMMDRIGGVGHPLGPIVGSLAVITLEDLTDPLNSYLGQVIFSGTLIVTLMWLPDGVVGLAGPFFGRFWGKRSGAASEKETGGE
ncbi:MAG: ABC transporter permease [Candidatus Bipolaricaulota bacterium]